MARTEPQLGHYRFENYGDGDRANWKTVDVRVATVAGKSVVEVVVIDGAGVVRSLLLSPTYANKLARGLLISAERVMYPLAVAGPGNDG